MITDREIIDELVQIRRERGLSQQDVADKIGTGRAAVCLFETRHERSPLMHTVLRYAEAIGADLAVLGAGQCHSEHRGRHCTRAIGHDSGWHDDGSVAWPVNEALR